MLAMNIIRAEGVMMFRPTCQNELEEMSRDGSRWLLEWCGAETEPSQPRELGVIGPLCDETVHVMYVLMSYGYRYCCHARGCFKRQQFNILYISIPALLHEQVESKVVHFGRHGKHAPEVSGNGCIRDMNLRLR